ncbi:MAG: hypothetical protein AB7V58_12420 [Solirubrobacterales bacterium]
MSQRFEKSPVRLRPSGGGTVSIESGGETVREDQAEERTGVPKPPPREPGWGVRLMRRDELLSELQIEGEGAEAALETALAKHQDADAVRIVHPARAVTRAQLKPLLKVSRRHGLPIDVLLRSDG